MSKMSDLHLLSGRVLDGEPIPQVANASAYPETEIAWATRERLLARCSEKLTQTPSRLITVTVAASPTAYE
jgi:hypothetical protein